jgi:hypothetical protein
MAKKQEGMKLFLVDYEWAPSGRQASVILANNEEEARNLAKEEDSAWRKEPIIGIKEICLCESGIVYTGHNCC